MLSLCFLHVVVSTYIPSHSASGDLQYSYANNTLPLNALGTHFTDLERMEG